MTLPPFTNLFSIDGKSRKIHFKYYLNMKVLKETKGKVYKDYCTRFNNIYNAIPTNIKPPQGLALIKFPDGFDADMSYQLRERNPATLEEMQRCVVSVEENLLAKRARQENREESNYQGRTIYLFC
jgi:hypothetical protein